MHRRAVLESQARGPPERSPPLPFLEPVRVIPDLVKMEQACTKTHTIPFSLDLGLQLMRPQHMLQVLVMDRVEGPQ